MKQSNAVLSVIAFLSGTMLFGCSTAVQLTSSWNDHAVVIDGSSREWGPSLQPITEPPIAIGARNDGEFLYVCLVTQSPFIQAQIINGGLTVWFDAKGTQEKSFGIRYPIHGENTPRWSPRDPLATNFSFIEPSFRELAILGPEGQQDLLSTLEAKGIKIKMGVSEGDLVYELQVPLRSSAEYRYAVGLIEGQTVSIGFETPEFGSDRLQGPSGRETAGTRSGGRRGGGRGAPAGGAPIEGTDRPEPLDFWAKTLLSSQR